MFSTVQRRKNTALYIRFLTVIYILHAMLYLMFNVLHAFRYVMYALGGVLYALC